MQAIVYSRFGPPEVLEMQTLPTPQPQPDEVLVRIYAAAVNPVDYKVRQGQTWFLTGWGFPKQLGADLSGAVEAVGKSVKKFQPGDQVFGMISAVRGGAYATHVAASAKVLSPKPRNLNHEEAAAVPLAALTALQALRDEGRLQAGQRVLINGSSGGVGTFAVQLAKVMGAEVTGVCSSRNLDLTLELGADRVLNYEDQEPTDLPHISFDLIFDTVGTLPFDKARLLLKPEGTHVTTQPHPYAYSQSFLSRLLPGGRRIRVVLTKAFPQDLKYLTHLLEENLIRPVIDSVYPLQDIRQAHKRSESGRAVGKIVVKVE